MKKTHKEREKQTITFKYFQMLNILLFFKAETTCAILLLASNNFFAYLDQSGWKYLEAKTLSCDSSEDIRIV